MRLSAFAILLVGTVASADSRLPAHYAKLFDPNASWTYEVTLAGSTTPVEVTCKVARVAKLGRVTASEVTCDGHFADELPIANVYLARADGLYASGLGFPEKRDEIGDFSLHMFLIAAKPKAASKTVRRYGLVDEDTVVPEDTTWETKRVDNSWCWVRTTTRDSTTTVDSRCFGGAIDHGVDRGRTFRLR